MHGGDGAPTVGVEEEFFLVRAGDRRPAPAGSRVLARAAPVWGDQVAGEFSECQVEARTPPCASAEELGRALARVRAGLVDATRAEGLLVCASGTPVLACDEPEPVGEHPRYRAGLEQYRAMLEDFAVCACHVHVHVPGREAAVFAANHLRPWLPLLVAISANSPYHRGLDTGYASWRSVIRSRFPCLGPPPYARSLDHHERLAVSMAESGATLAPDMPFWDLRPHPRLPTLEIRAMDVQADVADTVALAVLIRALVMDSLRRVRGGDPGPVTSSELLRAAYWRAARDGWSGSCLDVLGGRVVPTPEWAEQLIDDVRPALEEFGDADRVTAFLRRLTERGPGDRLQRAAAVRAGGLTGVVDDLVARTRGAGPSVRC
ncbi:carboxylate-amine ligase [Streptomyces chromofuscus]|uniref:carboxylate-amine ligase n=1 Tax=Streptomyces chromofuscus TaxID=42881 RepID=UPI0016743B78|nr:glutamate--cysteine ligase [Streptomyces chromofuscus]GGT15814.1 putative glutamate--cysteine ligase 2-3 [Streptomyces chromofuscus]